MTRDALASRVEDPAALGCDPSNDPVLLADRPVLDVIERPPGGIGRGSERCRDPFPIVRMQSGVEVRHRDVNVG